MSRVKSKHPSCIKTQEKSNGFVQLQGLLSAVNSPTAALSNAKELHSVSLNSSCAALIQLGRRDRVHEPKLALLLGAGSKIRETKPRHHRVQRSPIAGGERAPPWTPPSNRVSGGRLGTPNRSFVIHIRDRVNSRVTRLITFHTTTCCSTFSSLRSDSSNCASALLHSLSKKAI